MKLIQNSLDYTHIASAVWKSSTLRNWLLCYYYWTLDSEIRHGDRPHNYVSYDIFGFAVSPGLTKILPIEKCIFLDTLYYIFLFNLTPVSSKETVWICFKHKGHKAISQSCITEFYWISKQYINYISLRNCLKNGSSSRDEQWTKSGNLMGCLTIWEYKYFLEYKCLFGKKSSSTK